MERGAWAREWGAWAREWGAGAREWGAYHHIPRDRASGLPAPPWMLAANPGQVRQVLTAVLMGHLQPRSPWESASALWPHQVSHQPL